MFSRCLIIFAANVCQCMWMAKALRGLTDAFLDSRYVGETGKNIEKVFAEVGGWVSINTAYFYILLLYIFIQHFLLANDD